MCDKGQCRGQEQRWEALSQRLHTTYPKDLDKRGSLFCKRSKESVRVEVALRASGYIKDILCCDFCSL